MGQINGNWWPAANVRSRGQSTKFFYREGSATRSNFVPWPFINHFWHRKCSPCRADWNASEALLGFFTDRNDRIRYPFIYFNYRNPYAFIISLKLCTPFEIRSLPSQAILGCPPGVRVTRNTNFYPRYLMTSQLTCTSPDRFLFWWLSSWSLRRNINSCIMHHDPMVE